MQIRTEIIDQKWGTSHSISCPIILNSLKIWFGPFICSKASPKDFPHNTHRLIDISLKFLDSTISSYSSLSDNRFTIFHFHNDYRHSSLHLRKHPARVQLQYSCVRTWCDVLSTHCTVFRAFFIISISMTIVCQFLTFKSINILKNNLH